MLIFPQGIQGGVRWLLGLVGIAPVSTRREESVPDVTPPAGGVPASLPQPHEKEETQ
jgi:hypothetical protein